MDEEIQKALDAIKAIYQGVSEGNREELLEELSGYVDELTLDLGDPDEDDDDEFSDEDDSIDYTPEDEC